MSDCGDKKPTSTLHNPEEMNQMNGIHPEILNTFNIANHKSSVNSWLFIVVAI